MSAVELVNIPKKNSAGAASFLPASKIFSRRFHQSKLFSLVLFIDTFFFSTENNPPPILTPNDDDEEQSVWSLLKENQVHESKLHAFLKLLFFRL